MNFKVVEFEHEFEPGDLGSDGVMVPQKKV